MRAKYYAQVIGLLGIVVGVGPGSDFINSQTFTINELTVCSEGCRYQTITEAIAAAQDGDLIAIGAGTYRENLKISKNLTVTGESRERVIIQPAEPKKPIVEIESDQTIEVVLQGATVAGSHRIGQDVAGADGIVVRGKARLHLSDMRVNRNEGWGLYIEDGAQLSVERTQIFGNKFDGIYLEDMAKATATQNEVRGNGGCGINAFYTQSEDAVQGSENRMFENGADLCGNLSPELRIPLVEQTNRMQIVVPRDYQSLQEAVDALAPGGTIILEEGIHRGGVTIYKPLRLAGRDKDKATISGSGSCSVLSFGSAISLISGADATIEDVSVLNSVSTVMAGGTARFSLKRVTLGLYFVGIDLAASAQGTIEDAQLGEKRCEGFSNLPFYGIRALGSAQLSLTRSVVKGSIFTGIAIVRRARAVITDSEISKHMQGILIGGKAQVHLSRNRIMQNGYGVSAVIPECDHPQPEEPFAAMITGEDNYIPGPREPEGNFADDVCPDSLAFLKKP
ncbi:right-handed parallel beta-helix repeat-containing protein [Candidatus Acetothermia bacterium]|nr:right-handed parallel beta-helix repeat-containing protein [Candidatus Acetothermia bacterium]